MVKYFLVLLLMLGTLASSAQKKYQCIPCGNGCDDTRFDAAGECPVCHMKLVEVGSVTFGSVDPAKICDYIKSHPGLVLLDVRTKDEYEGKAEFGTLKNAINVPVQELEQRMGELAAYKNKEILVYCSHSRRSPRASYMLTQNGFKHVVNMEGGMSMVKKDSDCLKTEHPKR
ncbi:MAG: rhodanese-like domain-containing protein [Bacteroidetes bacterium]|nr:rhodanese-like domain-containing protein [Bacteroidota bacterium]